MKWRWAWRGALIPVAVWVGYIGAMVGLGRLSEAVQPVSQQPPWRRAAMSVYRVGSSPGEALVNAIWANGGYRLCPFERQTVPKPELGRWRLFPRVMLVTVTVSRAPKRALPPGAFAGNPVSRLAEEATSDGYYHAFTWSDSPRGFPLHLLLLPGAVVAVIGFLIGLSAGALRQRWSSPAEAQAP